MLAFTLQAHRAPNTDCREKRKPPKLAPEEPRGTNTHGHSSGARQPSQEQSVTFDTFRVSLLELDSLSIFLKKETSQENLGFFFPLKKKKVRVPAWRQYICSEEWLALINCCQTFRHSQDRLSLTGVVQSVPLLYPLDTHTGSVKDKRNCGSSSVCGTGGLFHGDAQGVARAGRKDTERGK